MQDTEEGRWLLLDMARAMGGYGYDEMWWANVYEPDDLEYSAPDLYEAFIHSADYDPDAHLVRRKEIRRRLRVRHGGEPAGRRLAHARRHRGTGPARGRA